MSCVSHLNIRASHLAPPAPASPDNARKSIDTTGSAGIKIFCLVWWMSFFAHDVTDVWCGGCLVWWMSGVMDVVQSKFCSKNGAVAQKLQISYLE